MEKPRNRYQDLRGAVDGLTDPQPSKDASQPIRRERTRFHHQPGARRRRAAEDDDTNIQPWMAAAFAELTRAQQTDAPFILHSCFVNGEPTALIGFVNDLDDEHRRAHVTPLFVAVTPGMVVIDHKGRKAW